MSDYCADEYDAWNTIDDALDAVQSECDETKKLWDDAFNQIFIDVGNGNYADALKDMANARDYANKHFEATAKRDRIKYGAWRPSVDKLWDCIDSHDWEE